MPAPPPESLPAIVRAVLTGRVMSSVSVTEPRGRRRFSEDEQILKRRHQFSRLEAQAGRFNGADDRLRLHAIFGRRTPPAASRQEVHDPHSTLRLERIIDSPQQILKQLGL